ncbi:MAG: hypothetical protein OQL08_02425 [Gammaproteobacteria bacterium]|nr:hypothetical protein [Gammaproteobacteria bacterium]
MSHRSPHSVMVEALEREISREERLHEFVQEAMQADRDIEEGGNIYRADDVHGWLKQLAQGAASKRPQPWRK